MALAGAARREFSGRFGVGFPRIYVLFVVLVIWVGFLSFSFGAKSAMENVNFSRGNSLMVTTCSG